MYPWLTIAREELSHDVKEMAGAKNNPRIVEYHQATDLHAKEDETPWCSAFVNWCMKQAGIVGTGKANARSWLDWGVTPKKPFEGCVVILSRGKSWQGHVGFVVGIEPNRVKILGGNQGNAVSAIWYPRSRVIGFRFPKGVEMPPLDEKK